MKTKLCVAMLAAALAGCNQESTKPVTKEGKPEKNTPVMAANNPAPGGNPNDWPMWGRTPDRNVVSSEKNPPTEWDVESGKNIKWVAQLGSQSYGNPVVAGGLVIVGTNNEGHRDPKIQGDASALMIFDQKTGKFLYQRVTPKHPAGRVNDWPYQGVCSTACVEGDLMWYATPRCEVVCLDLEPLKRDGKEPKEAWVYDMMKEQGVFPHNMTSSSTFVYQDWVYFITGNGVDETHKNLPAPDAPSIICFEKKTGKFVWSDNAPGRRILHGEWASPAFANVNGRPLVIAPLGDGWIYAYDSRDGKLVWKFDSNLKLTTYPTTRNELIATPVIVENKLMYIANGQDPEHGEGPGHMWCVDTTKTGDISLEVTDEQPQAQPGQELVGNIAGMKGRAGKPNPNSAVVWHFEKVEGSKKAKDRMNRTISTVAVTDGLVFAPDFSGYLHCFDAKTGKRYWVHDMESAMWSSPLIADGKIYLTDEDGDVEIIPVSKELDDAKVIKNNMGSASYCSPVLSNGVLYVMTREKLFAIGPK